MNELSIFVDESGDFGKVETVSPYYLVTMIFHEQDTSIHSEMKNRRRRLL